MPGARKRRLVANIANDEPSSAERHQVDWGSLLWMLSSFGLMYFSEFVSVVLFRASRAWLCVSVLLLLLSGGCVVYLARRNVTPETWLQQAPFTVAMGTISGALSLLCFTVSVWGVWGVYVLPMLAVHVMGAVSAVSLLNL